MVTALNSEWAAASINSRNPTCITEIPHNSGSATMVYRLR